MPHLQVHNANEFSFALKKAIAGSDYWNLDLALSLAKDYCKKSNYSCFYDDGPPENWIFVNSDTDGFSISNRMPLVIVKKGFKINDFFEKSFICSKIPISLIVLEVENYNKSLLKVDNELASILSQFFCIDYKSNEDFKKGKFISVCDFQTYTITA